MSLYSHKYQIPTDRPLTSEEIRAHYLTPPSETDIDNINKPSFQIATHMQEHLKYKFSCLIFFYLYFNDILFVKPKF